MPKASPIQTSFNAGEFTPLMYGRTDFDKYQSALALCKNFVPAIQGPLTRRPGTKYVANTKDNTKFVRLIPFEFSVIQPYMIEAGDLYFRFFKDNATITETPLVITGITQANPAVVTISGHGYSNGDVVFITGVAGMTEVNGKFYTVANVTASTFELSGVDSTGFTPYTSGGTSGKVYEIVSPYAEADLDELQFVQSADVLYIVHEDYAPRKLSRTGDAAWTLTAIDFLDGPFGSVNTDTANTLTPSGTTGSITVTAVNDTFVSTDVGRHIRFLDSASKWTWLEITAFTNTKVVTATVRGPDLATTTAPDSWRLGVWSDTTGYPSTVTFFEDRLFFGGATNFPQRIDGSKTGDYENFEATAADGTVAADNALSFTLNANQVNKIQWLMDGEKGLTVGTAGGEWIVRPSTLNEALNATNIKATRSTTFGSENTIPVRVGNAVLFVERSFRKLRELTYVFEIDGFRAPDLTILAEHLSQGGLDFLAYAQNPQPIVWAVRADGALLGMSYSRTEDAVGWHQHVIGGVSDAQGASAKVESIAVIPSSDGTRDELWMTVKRWVDGAEVRHVEALTKFWETGDTLEGAFFVDSGLTYSGSAVTSLSGLDHLEGEVVSILSNGATHPDKTVTDGAVSLDRNTTSASIGLSYNSDATTMRIDAGSADGTAQGKTKRIHQVVFRFFDTLGFKYGKDFGNLFILPFRKGSDPMNAPPPLFNGDTERLNWPGGYDQEGQLYFRQDQPLPCTVVAIMPQVVTQDR
jgi:hypothetical protein